MSRNAIRDAKPVYLTWTHPISGETILIMDCLGVDEMARRLRCSEQAVYHSCQRGRPMLCAGGCVAHYGTIGVIGEEEREEFRMERVSREIRLLHPNEKLESLESREGASNGEETYLDDGILD